MREVALVKTAYCALAREEELAGEEGLAGDQRHLVLVIVIVDDLRSPGPGGRVHRGPVLGRSLAAPRDAAVVPRHRPTRRGRIGSRCYGGAYLAPYGVP